jgi:L-lysine exporter family protein LysE/ArgO
MGFYLQGLTMGLAYVAPIGMQNLFVINSALTKTRRRALITAIIVTMFDVVLSLSCFFGAGALMQRYAWLQLAVLAVGGAVVIRIGYGLVKPALAGLFRLIGIGTSKHRGTGTEANNAGKSDATSERDRRIASAESNDAGLAKTVSTACVVTWFNPQAIIDGTLMLGAFSATLSASQASPFIIGVETASALWFLGLTLVISAFSHKFSPKIITVLNTVCGSVIILYGIKLLVEFATTLL